MLTVVLGRVEELLAWETENKLIDSEKSGRHGE